MREQVHIVVSGHVQGVSFRYYTEREASRLGLDGYVRNLPDGDVEIVAEGETDRLLELVAWARRGPSMARVTDARVRFTGPSGRWRGFRTRYD